FEGIKVVVDSGNGTAGLVAPVILKELGAEVIELYSEPDGRFPNHHPDPVVVENIQDLIKTVISEKAHLGIGFDGDADRIGVVDEEGDIVWGDRLMIIFARDILKENKGAKIIGEVKCSKVMYEEIELAGGTPVMWKTGHSLIKKKMKEEGALLAGEMSGHIFFNDRYFGYDDAIYASLRLIEIVKKAGKPYGIKKLLQGVKTMQSTPEIRISCTDEKKFMVVEKIKEYFKKNECNFIDGVRVDFKKGWALIRASNTQPALVLRFEAETEEDLEEIKSLIHQRLFEVFQFLKIL
ncbi:MAG: phosphomannomutase/phosphoglucomutase, partial [Thermodesulfovibrio sp.]|nr:phosphomannomutase/phosphoglucomutase [Thermodesulfovibrio sp.]